jgi:hypothetical protein
MRFRSSVPWILGAALLATTPASAQQTSGNLYGTITDDQGSPLPGATVTLTGQGAPMVQVTNALGEFRFLGLPPGSHQVKAELEGFSTVDYPNVNIGAGRNTTVEVTLSPAVEEVISVTTESPLLDERRISTGTTVTQTELDLPGVGSDPTPFLGGLNLDNGFYALPGSSGPINVPAGGNRASDDYQLFITIYVNTGPGGPSGGTAAPTQRLGQIESAPTWMGRLARGARDWLWTLLARPGAPAAASLAQARRETTLAPGTLVRLAQSSAGQAGSGAPRLSVVANGNSSGEAFELQVLSPTGETTQIVAPDGLVLQAVRRGAGEALRATAGQTLQRASMTGFCLEYEKPPPPADTIYQVAPQDLQQRYGPMRSVLRAGRAVAEAGGLNPDSNPLAYATAIQQWALWTRLEDWNLREFTDEFVEYTKKQVEDAGTRWTDQMRDLLRNAAPNRFNDITTVLQEADRLTRTAAD